MSNRSMAVSRMGAALGGVAVVVVVAGVLLAIVAGIRPLGQAVGSSDERPVSSCDDRMWPSTPVTCAEAQRSVSLGMSVTGARIWLAPLAAVDEAFDPKRQVADHPTDRLTPVWVFVYDGSRAGIQLANESGDLVTSPEESRVLHVADATSGATRQGAFVYMWGWTELGSPDLPSTLPAVAGS